MTTATRKVLTTGEVARVLLCHAQNINRLVDRGELPGYRMPGSNHRRVAAVDLARYVLATKFPLHLLGAGFGERIAAMREAGEL